MWHIFGDTDDITFWGGSSEPQSPEAKKPFFPRNHDNTKNDASRVQKPFSQKKLSPSRASQSVTPPREIEGGLKKLIESMKPSFFPQGWEQSLRLTVLSDVKHTDPFMIVRGGEGTLLFGTGFSEIFSSGKTYKSFPDMRLPYSEKDRLIGWVLLTPEFDIEVFQTVLDVLGFPHVYATRDVIAYIRSNVKDISFLDKCRFFEIFSPGMNERKVGEFLFENRDGGMTVSLAGDGIFLPASSKDSTHPQFFSLFPEGESFVLHGAKNFTFTPGEIVDISRKNISKNTLKFTFDTFYIDKNSVGIEAGYTLKDRELLAENGVLTFVLEEDVHARAIVGHIFIDSRGFVHAQEMMMVHKEVLKWIRHTYEQTILANQKIERAELVQILRRELTKYCYLLTGRTPVVMPIIIER